MPVVINGTTGITNPDGTAAAPALTGTDTNTGIFFPAADTIAFTEGGVEAMRINSSGNLGIGTNSPTSKLEVSGGASAPVITLSTTGVSPGAAIKLLGATAAINWQIGASFTSVNGSLEFTPSTTNGGSTFVTPALSIDSSGNVIYTQSSLACYVWTAFNPTNTSGTTTNAPATGTGFDTGFVTMVNSSGTLIITFDIAGKYLVSANLQTSHANTYTNERSIFNLGGTATVATGTQNPSFSGIDSVDANTTGSYPIYVSATAGQTTAILPTYELTGTGTTAQHTCRPTVTIQYCGG